MNQNLDGFKDQDCDLLIRSVGSRYRAIFEKQKRTDDEKRAIYRYLFSRKPKKLPPSLKNRLVNLYDPQADRSGRFPDGLRWCINVYVGCEHNCGYCYVNGYSQESVGIRPHAKVKFEQNLGGDLEALRSLGVPPAPLHISNSTDPLQQQLEKQNGHTLLSLKEIAKHRDLFTSVVILTKNPGLLCTEPYLSIIQHEKMNPFTVQVTCAYWNDGVRSFYEPKAPSIGSRLEAVGLLCESGIHVELRIDPLFPSCRIEKDIRLHRALPFYSMPEAQSAEDIVNLVQFAKKSKVKAVIAKPLKVPISKRAERCKNWFGQVYLDANAGKKRTVSSGSWRLPNAYQKALVTTVSELCRKEGVSFKHCMHDVLNRH